VLHANPWHDVTPAKLCSEAIQLAAEAVRTITHEL